jgi:folate-binding protein YgfZ
MMEIKRCLLPSRGMIRIGGPDKRTFLQGLISNDITLCQPDQPMYAALLTPQGKFLHDMFILDHGEDFLIDCESAGADDLLKRLAQHRLRAQVILENVAADYDIWALWAGQMPTTDAILYKDPRLASLGSRLVTKKNVAETLALASIRQTDFVDYDKYRLSLGIPDGSRDMLVEKSTLLECNLDFLNAISWNKGCYMGQELTARMHYRGLVKKRIFPVTIIAGPRPARGAIIHYAGEDIGEMRSHCEDAGLALLAIQKAVMAVETRAALICGDSCLMPHIPDWLRL